MSMSDDLFCVGQVIVEIMEGKPLFYHDDDAQSAYRAIAEDFKAGRTEGPAFQDVSFQGPERAFVDQLLDKNRLNRPHMSVLVNK